MDTSLIVLIMHSLQTLQQPVQRHHNVCLYCCLLQLVKISLEVAAFTKEMSIKCGNIVLNCASSYRKHLQLVMVKFDGMK